MTTHKRVVNQTENPFERSLKRFLLINLGEAEEKRFQLFDPPKAEIFEIAWSEP
jgi:hypothetical protein